MSPAFTDLPLQLTRRGPAHSGFATVQKTLTALWSEIRLRANPASLDFFPISEGAEDHDDALSRSACRTRDARLVLSIHGRARHQFRALAVARRFNSVRTTG